ncbi:MAG TPA: hypothetical protein VFS21_01145 [Roseiflexaceae bacterium]|nr:hypothetical protein [Roseiflexaceae bacterium]
MRPISSIAISAYMRTIDVALQVWLDLMAAPDRDGARARLLLLLAELDTLEIPRSCAALHERLQQALQLHLHAEALDQLMPGSARAAQARREARDALDMFRSMLYTWSRVVSCR